MKPARVPTDEDVYGPGGSSATGVAVPTDEDVYGPGGDSVRGVLPTDEDVYGPTLAPKPTFGERLAGWGRDAGDIASYLVGAPGHGSPLYDLGLMEDPEAKYAKPFVGPAPPPIAPQPERTVLGTVGDVADTIVQAGISVPEAVVGLADYPTKGYAGKALDAIGFDFKTARDVAHDLMRSPAQEWAAQQVEHAQGAVPTLKQMFMNPSTIATTAAESIPGMVLGTKEGQLLAKGAGALGKVAPVVAPAAARAEAALAKAAPYVGEAGVSAGQAAEQVRQQTPGGTLSWSQLGTLGSSGILTGLLSAGGGRMAKKFGVGDIDEFIAGLGRVSTEERTNIVNRMVKGMISEGVFEEWPQSLQEQIAQNIAMGKPWDEGVAEAGAQGLVTGAAFGAYANRKRPPTKGEALANALGYDIHFGDVPSAGAFEQGDPYGRNLAVGRSPQPPAVSFPGGAPEPAVGGAEAPPAPVVPGAAALPPGSPGSALAAALGIELAGGAEPAPAGAGSFAQRPDPELVAAGADAARRAADPFGGLAAALQPQGEPNVQRPEPGPEPRPEPGGGLAAAIGGAPGVEPQRQGRVDVPGQAQAAAPHGGVAPGAGPEPVAAGPGAGAVAFEREIDRERAQQILETPAEQRTPQDVAWYEGWRGREAYPYDSLAEQPAGQWQAPGGGATSWLHADEETRAATHEAPRAGMPASDEDVYGPTYRPAGGELPAAQVPEPPKAGQKPGEKPVKEVDTWYENPLLKDLRRVGMHPELMTEFAPGPTEQEPLQKKKGEPLKVFREGGLEIDDIHHWMIEEGYLPPSSTESDDAYDLIKGAIRGERIFPIYSEKGQAVMERMAQRASWEEAKKIREEWEAAVEAGLRDILPHVDNADFEKEYRDAVERAQAAAAQAEAEDVRGAVAAPTPEPVAAGQGAGDHAARSATPEDTGAAAGPGAPEVGAQPEEPGRVEPAAETADERASRLHKEWKTLEYARMDLRRKDGRQPYEGTKARKEWDALTEKINAAYTAWQEAEDALRAEKKAAAAAPAPAPEPAPEPAPAPAPAPAEEPVLQMQTEEELAARQAELDAREAELKKREAEAEKKAKAEAEAREVKARQASSAEGFELGQDQWAGLTGQDQLLEAITTAQADVTHADEESKAPPEAVGEDFMARAFTRRPSQWLDAWAALGLDPNIAAGLPIGEQLSLLTKLYKEKFGITVKQAKGAITKESVDNLRDGYRNITGMLASLGLPQNAIGLNGTLTLSLEKYNPKRGYLGMYDPTTRTIHMPGRSNSFGHEWFHALDHYMTLIAGKDKQDPDKLFSYTTATDGANINHRVQGTFAALVTAVYSNHAQAAWKILQLQVKASERNMHGDPTPAATHAQQQLDEILSGKLKALGDVEFTDYARKALEYEPGRESYWANPAEMLARAFEAYVSSQRPKNINEFVTKAAASYLDNVDERFAATFPKEQERTQIFHAFDNYFAALAEGQELGVGPTAELPTGEGLWDPSRWNVYPNNQPRWQRMVESERDTIASARTALWGVGDLWDWSAAAKNVGAAIADKAKNKAVMFRDGLLATFAAQRGHMDAIWHRYGKPAALAKLRDMLYVNRGEGRYVGSTYHEATSTRIRSRLNDLNNLVRQAGVGKMTRDENQYLRNLLISAYHLTSVEVKAELAKQKLDVSPGRRLQLQALSANLTHLMDKEYYYNTSNGIKLGYAANGYLPRNLDYEAFGEDKDGFEAQAGLAYRAQFDRDVGTDAENVDRAELLDAAKHLTASDKTKRFLRDETRAALEQMLKIQQQIKKITQAIATSEDPDELFGKLAQYEDSLADATDHLLPLMRQDWAALAAHDWRTRIDTPDIADYDVMGPASTYTKGRSLPPEADVFMQDYYRADPLDAIAEYLERSTRRVEYAKRFGVNNEKLKEILATLAQKHDVSKRDIAILQGMVNNATGRENHSAIPSDFTLMANWVNHIMTMYLLGRATFASLSEPAIAFWRTGNVVDIVRPFGAMMQDVVGHASAMERRSIANLLGLVTTPHADMLMANRLTGETYSKQQSMRMGRFFERTLLAPLTRAQQRAMITVGHQYLMALTGKPGHTPSRAELRELGIPNNQQAAFAEWLKGLNGQLPTPKDLVDPNTDELHPMGVIYGTALKRFNDQVIMEPSKMDKPKLATNPIARFAFGIMSFMYAFWHQVQKPFLRQMVKDGKTILRQATGRSDPDNAGRTAIEAATRASLAMAAVGVMYMGQVLSTILRAALLDRDKWKEHEEKGDLVSWIAKLAFWRSGFAGPADPLVQAFVGLKYRRDLTGTIAGPQFGSVAQNVQDIAGVFVGNAEGTNTNERKAAKGFYNLTIGPLITWAAAAAPGGAIIGPILGALATLGGTGSAQEAFADAVAGSKYKPESEKRVRQPDGSYKVQKLTPAEIRHREDLAKAKAKRARERDMREKIVRERRAAAH